MEYKDPSSAGRMQALEFWIEEESPLVDSGEWDMLGNAER